MIIKDEKVQCGDIIKYPAGHMIVESIRPDGMFVGHKLSASPIFVLMENPQIINSEFRYAAEIKSKVADTIETVFEYDKYLMDNKPEVTFERRLNACLVQLRKLQQTLRAKEEKKDGNNN